MFRNLLCLVVGAIILAGCVHVYETRHIAEEKCTKKPARLLRHVVLFKFKDSSTEEQVKQIEDAFCALPDKIDAIHDLEWGTDVSVENHQQGFTHCFLVTFLSEDNSLTASVGGRIQIVDTEGAQLVQYTGIGEEDATNWLQWALETTQKYFKHTDTDGWIEKLAEIKPEDVQCRQQTMHPFPDLQDYYSPLEAPQRAFQGTIGVYG